MGPIDFKYRLVAGAHISKLIAPMAQSYKEALADLRDKLPLPAGWSADTSTLEAFLTPGYCDTADNPNPPLIQFNKDCLQVRLSVSYAGRLDIEFTDATGRGVSAPEMIDLVTQLLGVRPNLKEELKHYHNSRKNGESFSRPSCPGRPWRDRSSVCDEIFEHIPFRQGSLVSHYVPFIVSRATARDLLKKYRVFRAANPLPLGWTDDTTQMEDFIETVGVEFTGSKFPVLAFYNYTRTVEIEFEESGDVYYYLWDSAGYGFSVDEILNLPADLAGFYADQDDLIEEWARGPSDFPRSVPCGKKWQNSLRISGELIYS